MSSHYILALDIDLGSVEFTAIGSYSSRFTGTFDGDGHVISGLYINLSNQYQGLFGYIDSATIKNLGISGSVTGTSYTGGVVGNAVYSTVSGCYYDSDVETSVDGAVYGEDFGTDYCGLTTEKMKGSIETEGTLLYYLSQNNNTSWTTDTNNINNGYPILSWQLIK